MKKFDVFAVVLIVVVLIQRISSQTLQMMAVEWGIEFQWTSTQINQVFWYLRMAPFFILHLGFALWLQELARRENDPHANRWGLFGLCFGLPAAVVFLTRGIVRK